MDHINRREFMRGAALGALAFSVGAAQVLLTAREARAQGVPFRLLKAGEAETIEALGETLVPGARAAGISHFIDHQLSVPPEDALLEARILNVKPPYANFYRAAIGAIDKASQARSGRRFAQLDAAEQREFVGLMRVNKLEGWQGPAGSFVRGLSTLDSRSHRLAAESHWYQSRERRNTECTEHRREEGSKTAARISQSGRGFWTASRGNLTCITREDRHRTGSDFLTLPGLQTTWRHAWR